eukprot:4323036-Pleurochrysis_carterae.AAC.1
MTWTQWSNSGWKKRTRAACAICPANVASSGPALVARPCCRPVCTRCSHICARSRDRSGALSGVSKGGGEGESEPREVGREKRWQGG